jgi:hypothetical protein
LLRCGDPKSPCSSFWTALSGKKAPEKSIAFISKTQNASKNGYQVGNQKGLSQKSDSPALFAR